MLLSRVGGYLSRVGGYLSRVGGYLSRVGGYLSRVGGTNASIPIAAIPILTRVSWPDSWGVTRVKEMRLRPPKG
jgi:hypothetical protein